MTINNSISLVLWSKKFSSSPVFSSQTLWSKVLQFSSLFFTNPLVQKSSSSPVLNSHKPSIPPVSNSQ